MVAAFRFPSAQFSFRPWIKQICAGAGLMALLAGCASNPGDSAAELQKSMAADHQAVVATLTRINAEARPFLIQQAVEAPDFSAEKLSLVAPADIAAWDKILAGLDNYCAALSNLASAKYPEKFEEATEAFGCNIRDLAKAAKLKPIGAAGAVETAVAELGEILVRRKADASAVEIAREADPHFQAVILGLVEALGFSGRPPVPAPHGLLATYEDDYAVFTAEENKKFRGGGITGFADLTAAQRKAAIEEFIRWQADGREHQDLVAAVKTLATALTKAAAAHAELAKGSPESAAAALNALKADVQDATGIYQKFSKG